MSERLTEIAARIAAHLKRFEADKDGVNKDSRGDGTGRRPYFGARAYVGGNRLRVVYVSYQGPTTLPRPLALSYLAWLDAGNVGKHYTHQRAGTIGAQSNPEPSDDRS